MELLKEGRVVSKEDMLKEEADKAREEEENRKDRDGRAEGQPAKEQKN